MYFLGMDIGTTNQKVLLTTEAGEKVASASRSNATAHPARNQAEQDPEQWWENTISLLREVEEKAGPGSLRHVQGISISSHTVSLVPVSAEGRPVRPALIWMDGRSADALEQVVSRVGRKRYVEIVGGQPDVAFLPGKLRWFAQNEPALLARTAWCLQANGYVNLKLTGNATMDLDQACRTQCYDLARGCWSEEIGSAIGVDLAKLLPAPAAVTEIIGRVTAEASRLTGLAAGTPVVAGCCDAMASLYAIGLRELGQAGESSGTTSLVFAGSASPSAMDAPVTTKPCSLPGIPYVYDAPINTTGAAVQWFLERLGGQRLRQAQQAGADVFAELNAMAAESAPGSRGLLFLPYLRGERAPLWNSFARGMLVGLTMDTTQEDMARAVFEGTAFALRHVLETISDGGTEIRSLRITGGGARSLQWAQIKADVLQMPVHLMDDGAGDVPLGDVLIARQALTGAAECAALLKPKMTLLPDPALQERYQRFYHAYRAIYEKLQEEQKYLAQINRDAV